MREFEYWNKWEKLLTPDIVSLLTKVHEYKGEQRFLQESGMEALVNLSKAARIKSIESFNKIEGLYVAEERMRNLLKDKTRPRTENEQEIAGYRDVLNIIYRDYAHIPLKPSILLQLHRDLYKYEGFDNGGKYRTSENAEGHNMAEKNYLIDCELISAEEIPEAMDRLCRSFEKAAVLEKMEPLLLIPMFLLDFLCLQPFRGGNGRMSRLLLVLLLSREGYFAGQYSSMEKWIEHTRAVGFDCLRESSSGWIEDVNSYKPFVKYILGIVTDAYEEVSFSVNYLLGNEMSKSGRVRELIKSTPECITKKEILSKCPDISQITVQRALAELVENGEIIKIGGGRYTKYRWKY